jgi:hypothetical protein
LKDVKAFSVDGKPIERKKLRGLLKKETAVLVSADGKEIDPFYLQMIKEGTIILLVQPVIHPPAVAEPPPPVEPPAPPVPPR